MIRICTEADRESLAEYLKEEPYGRLMNRSIEEYGFERPYQTVYVDEEPPAEGGRIKGVYLWFCKNLLLYVKGNQVAIDFLEETMGIAAPEWVAGRKDNVNIVSWLLTDYQMENGLELPEICGADGEPVKYISSEEHAGEWSVLRR